MRRTAVFVWLVALLLVFLSTGEALGSRVGAGAVEPGRIAFASGGGGDDDIYVMNADGTGRTNLTNSAAYDAAPAWSPDGSKIAFSSDRDPNRDIYVMNADGTGRTNLTNSAAYDAAPAWSPDGSKIAFSRTYEIHQHDGKWDYEIYVMNADGTGQTRLTNNAAWDNEPTWSPDGTQIAFASGFAARGDIYVMNADGTGQTNLTNGPTWDQSPSWSPDGSKIAFASARGQPEQHLDFEIYVMNTNGTGAINLSNSPGQDMAPAWSPDGSKIAFASARDGNYDIYVMNADGTGQTNLTSSPAIDRFPTWQPLPMPCNEGSTGLNICDLQKGDIVLSHNLDAVYAAENLLFGGYWTHAGIYNGDGTFTDSIPSEGVRVASFKQSSFWDPSDWAILRTNQDGGKRDEAIAYARRQAADDDPYNWNFLNKETEDKFYCSQLVWRAYYEQDIDLDNAWGVPLAVPPDDIYFDDDVTLVKQRPGIGATLRRAVLRVLSPANLYVTDPEGRHTGVDPNTGQVVEEIPGVFYSGPEAEPEFLSIEDMSGAWEIQVVGTDEGSYTLQLEDIEAEDHGLTEVDGEAREGAVTTYEASHLAPGWNSRCYTGEQKPVEEGLAEIIGSVVAVYRLEPDQTFARWFPSRPDVSTVSALNPYDQLFILTSGPTGWVQESATASQTSVDLVQGWNSMCYAGPVEPIAEALSGLHGDVAVLYRLGEDQTWARYVPDRPEVSNMAQLKRLDALLMLVTQPGGARWTFGPSVTAQVYDDSGTSIAGQSGPTQVGN